MKITKFAPVLITTMNRYKHLKRCLDSLSKNIHASKTQLYIALDAPASEGHKKGYADIITLLIYQQITHTISIFIKGHPLGELVCGEINIRK